METSVSLLERLRQPTPVNADWNRLVAIYSPLVREWAKKAGLQEADAADLTQEVLAHLLKKMPEFRYRAGGSFRAWLRTVTLNLWRAKQRKAAVAAERTPLHQAAEPITDDPAAEFWEADFQQHVARQALQIMKSEFQETTWKACWAVVVDERPAADVAAELGLSPGAVYAAKFRVLSRLREELAGLMDE